MRSDARSICFYALLFWVAFSTAAFAKDNPSYTQVGRNINVGPNDKIGDLTCFGCSIHIRGEVVGDVTAFGGSVTVEDQAQVAGDVSIFGGDARLDRGVRVAGDVSVLGGQIHRDPQAAMAGDVTSFGGHGWLLPDPTYADSSIGLVGRPDCLDHPAHPPTIFACRSRVGATETHVFTGQ